MASELRFDTWQNKSGTARKAIINHAHFVFQGDGDVYNQFATGTPGTLYDTPITITYTPLRANSILYLYGCAATRIIGPYGVFGGIKRDGTKLPGNFEQNSMDFFYKGDNSVNHHRNLEFRANVTANSTAATTFRVWLAAWNGSGNGELSNGYGQNFIQVWEVAQ
jgi:hypothetical protein